MSILHQYFDIRKRRGKRTGGCSSVFSPVSGLALKFAKTPSDADPPPYTLPVVGAKAGKYVALLSIGGAGLSPSVVVVVGVLICSADALDGLPRINFCLSSPSFSSSLSDPSASNVSAKFWSTGSLCLEVGEEVRDRKEGGGESGI